MCVAVPGKITKINDNRADVAIGSSSIPVELGLVKAEVGDYVLVHAGLAIEVVSPEEAKEIIDIFSELEELANEQS